MNAREVSLSAIFIALTTVAAWVTIPLGQVPITFQVMMVLLSGLLLGSRLGFLTQLLYVLAGAVGFPIFSGFSGGLAHIFGPTGGYIVAFPISAFVTGYIAENTDFGWKGYAIGSLFGLSVIYLFGWLWLGFYLGGAFRTAFEVGVLPFVGIDLVKVLLAVTIAKRVGKQWMP